MSVSQSVYEALVRENLDLKARLAEAERDAARYRWLVRGVISWDEGEHNAYLLEFGTMRGSSLNAAIDREIAAAGRSDSATSSESETSALWQAPCLICGRPFHGIESC